MNVNSVQSSTFGGQTTPAIHAVKRGFKFLQDSANSTLLGEATQKATKVANKNTELSVSIGDKVFTVQAPTKGLNILA